MDLKPGEIVSDWYALKISLEQDEVDISNQEKKHDESYYEVLKKIEQAVENESISLDLSHMHLTEIPKQIKSLSTLKSLKLIGNNIIEIPSEIGELRNLVKLNLDSNCIEKIPKEITHLENLQELYLFENNLDLFDISITQLKKLTILSIGNNRIDFLPKKIKNMKSLKELFINNNDISSLPSELGEMTNLNILQVNHNKISCLPSEIGFLTNLEHLKCHNNRLRSIPREIGKLNKLTTLTLYENLLESLPLEIGLLDNLRTFNVDRNYITSTSIPSSTSQLKSLRELYMYDNDMETIPPCITKIKSLQKLSLGNNKITELPANIGDLINLNELHIDNNCITELPASIGNLKKLVKLNCRNNSLIRLPKEIKYLSNLSNFNIVDNDNFPVPPELVKHDNEPQVIINYYLYLSIKNNNTRQPLREAKPLHEAKMLLVGQANVGKTCLKKRFMEDHYDPARNKTDGIDIEPWEIKVENKKLQVNIWDFGGQEIMHSTHQFFLTKRSLYLLVLDNTIGEGENRIEYWLKIIQSFGKDAPVVIVGNKADQHPLDIDKTGLKQKYPQIRAFYEVSCKTAKGISELQEFVKQEINQLEHINDVLPLSWFNIKEKLEKIDKDYISYEQYESLCEEEGVEEEDKQRILIRLLNDLGIVLNFQDDPRLEDTHVLNPEWVTNGVYKILNDRSLIVDNCGILTIPTLKRILNKKRYPAHKLRFIIGMMRKFELCFDIESDKKFLIPDILPKGESYRGEWDNTLAFEYHYPVLPGSIISRFIVRMSHYIHKRTYWRSGVVLENEGNLALVKADREDKIIKIHVKGKENTRRNLLKAIRSQFDYIHSTIPGIVPVEKVPLREYPEIILDYQELLGLESMGETYKVIGTLKKRIPLRQLLDGIESLGDRRNRSPDTRIYHGKIR
ncbi:MAG: COR domain-containing protein [Cyanobacteria bacterium J06621_8]